MTIELKVTLPLKDEDRKVLAFLLGDQEEVPSAPRHTLVPEVPSVPQEPEVETEEPEVETGEGEEDANGLGVDAKGFPWDERIHSSNRAKNTDGTWRYRRNVPQSVKDKVEAELSGLSSATPAEIATGAASAAHQPAIPSEVFSQAVPPVPAPSVPPPPAPPVAAAPAAGLVADYPMFVRELTDTLSKRPDLPSSEIEAIIKRNGASSIADVASQSPEVIGAIIENLRQLQGGSR